MAHNNIEIEIKVAVENVTALKDFLQQQGTFKGEKHQVDEYFSPTYDDFMKERPVNRWLRIRDVAGKCSMDYKLWHRSASGQSEYCDEIETGIDNIDQARKMLQFLNFKSIAVVDKTRLAWRYENFEIAIDSVKGLGDFVEIEYMAEANTDNAQAIGEHMIQFLKDAHCGKITKLNTGYPMLMLFPQETELQIL